jgi:hypothetical protein
MFTFIKNLFGKQEEVKASPASPSILTFSIEEADGEHIAGVRTPDVGKFLDFIRNSDYELDITRYTDAEIAHLFVYMYCQRWLSEHLSKPMFTETHTFTEDDQIRYDRVWNQAFVQQVSNIGFEVLPNTQEEIVEAYMNYVYSARMMEEMEVRMESEPTSVAHPDLSNPANQLKR